MIVEFNKENHTYSVNGELATISVTELLSNQGISPDYSKINKIVLENKANWGELVHNEIDDYFKNGTNPETEEAKNFINYARNEFLAIMTEQKLGLIYKDIVIAGTCDVLAINDDEKWLIADHKTTSTIHKDSVSWQVSIYDYMLRKCGEKSINELNVEHYKGADKFVCYWYKNGNFEEIELAKIPDEEIEKLLDCFINGEKYHKQELIIGNDLKMQIEQAEQYLAEVEISYKNAKKQAEELRQQLINLMEQQKVKTFETENIKITYIAEQERETIDTKLLKEKNPEIYESCKKTSKVKSGVRITIKNNF